MAAWAWAVLGALLQDAHGTPSVGAVAPTAVRAIRVGSSITIDGKLTESAWATAEAGTELRQLEPVEGGLPSEATAVTVLFDDAALYLGVRLFDRVPDSIVARLGRRDNGQNSDAFTVFLDPYRDRRSGFFFSVNAAGTITDGTLFNDDWRDTSWDGVWEARVHRDSTGWTAEIRIPFSQLRFRQAMAGAWGINFERAIPRRKETDLLEFTPKDGSGFVSRFRPLVGLDQLTPPARLELRPYLVQKGVFRPRLAADPFGRHPIGLPSAGLDAKVGLGSSLTLDATLNPDFGQVEVDPAVINLSDAETYYPERRPFFIEGRQIFDFGSGGANNFWGFNWAGPSFFYSRRIGRAPQRESPTADYLDRPETTTILGAAKLSGQVAPGTSVGGFVAVTGRESIDYQLAGERASMSAEPATGYTVGRILHEARSGRWAIGALGTSVVRRVDPDLRATLSSDALTGGVDGWVFLDRKRVWALTGWFGASTVHGTRERITALQQDPAHYFQRPDAGYLGVDSTRTGLDGYAGRVLLNKQQGDWRLNAAFGAISPGFEVNDAGLQYRGDQLNGHVVGTRRWTKQGPWFRQAEVALAGFGNLDYGGAVTWAGLFHSGWAQLNNFAMARYLVAVNPTIAGNWQTRGGPRMTAPGGIEMDASIDTDSRRTIAFGAGVHARLYGDGSARSWSFVAGMEWRPQAALTLAFRPTFSLDRTGAQYVGTFADPTAAATFGQRYVFGTLAQSTFAATVRVNWVFSPELSLEVFAQPLIASGRYRQFKALAAPSTYRFLEFGRSGSTLVPPSAATGASYRADADGGGPAPTFEFADPNFSVASLRGNAVLRWEFHPGSALFLVWTQSRSDDDKTGEFRFGPSLQRLFTTAAENVLAVKISYWWTP